jgi:hypothetical protein
LKEINLAGNKLNGSITDNFTYLSDLRLLDYSLNDLTGTMPKFLSVLQQLQHLNFAGNDLEGSVPSSFIELRSLLSLDVDSNSLHGSLDFLPRSLKTLRLGNNNFTGDVLSVLCDASNISSIDIDGLRTICNPLCFDLLVLRNISDDISNCGYVERQRQALLDLLQSSGGALSWVSTKNWNTSFPLKDWHGIKTSGPNVVSIDLSFNGLRGKSVLEG